MALVGLDSLQKLDSRHVQVFSIYLHLWDKYLYLIKWLHYHFLMGIVIISTEEYFKINLIWLLENHSEAMGPNDLCTCQPCDII